MPKSEISMSDSFSMDRISYYNRDNVASVITKGRPRDFNYFLKSSLVIDVDPAKIDFF